MECESRLWRKARLLVSSCEIRIGRRRRVGQGPEGRTLGVTRGTSGDS